VRAGRGAGNSGNRTEGSLCRGKSNTAGSNATSAGSSICGSGAAGCGIRTGDGGGMNVRVAFWQDDAPIAPAMHSVAAAVLGNFSPVRG
jgi:hypothetical protein